MNPTTLEPRTGGSIGIAQNRSRTYAVISLTCSPRFNHHVDPIITLDADEIALVIDALRQIHADITAGERLHAQHMQQRPDLYFADAE